MSAFCHNSEHYSKVTYLHILGDCGIVNLGVIAYLELTSDIPSLLKAGVHIINIWSV